MKMKLVKMYVTSLFIFICVCHVYDLYNIAENDTSLTMGFPVGIDSSYDPHKGGNLASKQNRNQHFKFIDVNHINTEHAFKMSSHTINKLIGYYHNLGISVNISKFLTKTNNTIISDIFLRYPKFNRILPNFICKQDKEIFMSVEKNVANLKAVSNNQLRGQISYIYGGNIQKNIDCGWKNSISDYEHHQRQPKIFRDINTKSIAVPLLVPDGNSFQHFVDGVMPKLAQISPFLINKNLKLFLDHPRDKIITEIIIRMGVNVNRVKYYTNPFTVAYQLNTCITPPIHPILWQVMRTQIGVPHRLKIPLVNASVILLTRPKTFNKGRRIKNLQEIVQYLKSRYNDNLVIFKGGYNLNDSINLFSSARIVIGVHGGAFYNINFSPKQTTVVEYLPGVLKKSNSHLAERIIWNMASIIGQTFYRLYEKALNVKGDIHISLPKLKAVLDKIDHDQEVV